MLSDIDFDEKLATVLLDWVVFGGSVVKIVEDVSFDGTVVFISFDGLTGRAV